MADAWATCAAYLERECRVGDMGFPPTTMRYAHLLWVLSEALAATKVLEIGIGPSSVSGATFVHSMASRGHGHLISVDVDQTLPAPKYRALADAQGIRWDRYYGDSLEVASHIPIAPGYIDLLYVDGDHDEAHAYGDVHAYLPFLRPGGYLVIDDCPAFEGVTKAYGRLLEEGFSFVHIAHEPPHWNGRLLWQKPFPDSTWYRR